MAYPYSKCACGDCYDCDMWWSDFYGHVARIAGDSPHSKWEADHFKWWSDFWRRGANRRRGTPTTTHEIVVNEWGGGDGRWRELQECDE